MVMRNFSKIGELTHKSTFFTIRNVRSSSAGHHRRGEQFGHACDRGHEGGPDLQGEG